MLIKSRWPVKTLVVRLSRLVNDISRSKRSISWQLAPSCHYLERQPVCPAKKLYRHKPLISNAASKCQGEQTWLTFQNSIIWHRRYWVICSSPEADTEALDKIYNELYTFRGRDYHKISVDRRISYVPVDEVSSYLPKSNRASHAYNNKEEAQRLDEQHEILKTLHGARTIIAPIINPSRILDCGYGSGTWAVEVADLYPSCAVSQRLNIISWYLKLQLSYAGSSTWHPLVMSCHQLLTDMTFARIMMFDVGAVFKSDIEVGDRGWYKSTHVPWRTSQFLATGTLFQHALNTRTLRLLVRWRRSA
jgi:hypothetical protein